MADNGAVVQQVDMQTLAQEVDQRNQELRQLEADLQEKEAEVRRTREEHTLMKELQAINQIALRKVNSATDGPFMRASDDSQQEIMTLESKIKLLTKKTQELQKAFDFQQASLNRISESVEQEDSKMTLVKEVTGWDRHQYGAAGFTNEENRFKQYQKVLTNLEEQQNVSKQVTSNLTKRIEELTSEMEHRKNIDDELATATEMLKQKENQRVSLQDDKKSLIRITTRKESLLNKTSKPVEDQYRAIKRLEGDKRALHADLLKAIDSKKGNDRAIYAQDSRLRQLEVRLEAINGFLAQLFEGDADSADHRPPVESGDGVPVADFEAVQHDLAKSRKLISAYDQKLEKLDADVEINVKKCTVLQYAVVAKTSNAMREEQVQERDRGDWEAQLGRLQEEFDDSYDTLESERDELLRQIEEVDRALSGGPAPSSPAY